MKSKLQILVVLASVCGAVGPAPAAFAQQMAGMSTQDYYTRLQGLKRQANGIVVFAEQPWVVAKVKAIDSAAGKMTISHGPIRQIRMPAMTMAFPVRNPSDLSHNVGDVIQVQFDNDGGVVKISHVRGAKD